MSRAFTSEEYEAPQVVYEPQEERKRSEDYEVVFAYSKGRDFSDPSLPYEIGIHFIKGDEGFFQSNEFGEKWLARAVEMGSTSAMLALADFYMSDTKAHGYRKPALMVKKAAEAGSVEARDRLDYSNITDRKSKKTYLAYRYNAELGDVEAMMLLAEGFEKGNFGKDKFKAAKTWYIRAFKKGRAEAGKKTLAMFYKKKIELTDEELKLLRS